MVFEGIVAELVNTFLGDFVENLDASQLKLGIWGGDVKLSNLSIKESALDELDLPFKLKFGYLSSLVLKIPWKNLYTEPVIATIEGLHVVVVPNIDIKYNAEKEEKAKNDAKQKELSQLEEARKARRQKKGDAPPDTFAEKMVTQVIKNLQVTVQDIHVRFEDRYSNRDRPFAAGLTLHSLFFKTTDADWKPCIIKEAVTQIHKVALAVVWRGELALQLVDLDSLAVYWNAESQLFSLLDDVEQVRKLMASCVASKGDRPKQFSYIVEPISVSAKLRLNQKPETDGSNFSIPKILLHVGVEAVAVRVGKYQYQDSMLLLDSQERFAKSSAYRKYRPNVTAYKGHAREWWHFAYACVLEETVRRKQRNWSWQHMAAHCALVRSYKDAWVKVQTQKSPGQPVKDVITKAELELDVFNLNVARQQAEIEIDKRGLTRVEDQQGWVSWAASWVTGGKKSEDSKEKAPDVASQFEAAMTADEKAKLYAAIDYQENAPPTNYPIEFVENKVHFSLQRFTVGIYDNISSKKRQNTLDLTLSLLTADLEMRPSARAIDLRTSLKDMAVMGLTPTEGAAPQMLQMAAPGGKSALLSAHVETNPLNLVDGRRVDQCVQAAVQSVMIIYHAHTINRLVAILRPPEAIRLDQLSAAAMAKYDDVKGRSVTGLQHAVEQRANLHLDVVVHPTLVVVPETGVYTRSSTLLVASFGKLVVKTITADASIEAKLKLAPDERLKALLAKAYDNFKVELSNFQLLFCRPGDDWRAALKEQRSSLHLLQPTGFEVTLHKAAIDDLQVPKFRVFAHLPDIVLHISDRQVLDLLKLGLSIPLPESPPDVVEEEPVAAPSLKERAKMRAIMQVNADAIVEEDENKPDEEDAAAAAGEQSPQQVMFEFAVLLDLIAVDVTQEKDGRSERYLSLRVKKVGANFKQRPFDAVANASIGGILVEHFVFKNLYESDKNLYLLDGTSEEAKDLLTLSFVMADRRSPSFATDYKLTEQRLTVDVRDIRVSAHREAIVDLLKFANELSASATKRLNERPAGGSPRPGTASPAPSRLSTMRSASMASLTAVGRRIRPRLASGGHDAIDAAMQQRVVKLKVVATIGAVELGVGSKAGIVTAAQLNGLRADVTMREKEMDVETTLRHLAVTDPTPDTIYSKVLSVSGQEVFRVIFTQFNRSDAEREKMAVADVDMALHARLTKMEFTFRYRWLSRLINWAAPFQEELSSAATQAGAAVAESATDAAQKLAAQAPKVRLDVDLDAPVVTVPRNSQSHEVVLLNFGKIVVENAFSQHQTGAVLENIAVKLTELMINRAQLSETSKSECHILQPITLTLSVCRNLAFETRKEVPEIGFTASLPEINVSLTQEDLGFLLLTSSENMGEAEAPPPRSSRPPATPRTPTAAVAGAEMAVAAGRAPSVVVVAADREADASLSPPNSSSSAIRVRFDCSVVAIKAGLYTGSSHLGVAGVVARDAGAYFAALDIERIAASGSLEDDGGADVALLLADFVLDDKRSDATSVSRLMQKRLGDLNLIDVGVKLGSGGEMLVDAKLRPFTLYLCPEFIGAMMRFVSSPLEAKPAASGAPPPLPVAESKPKAAAAPVAAAAKPFVLSVRATIDDPEVILVEEPNRPDQSQALILKLRAVAEVDWDAAGKQNESFKIEQLQIFSSFFREEKRTQRKIEVLKPCEIALTHSREPGVGELASVHVTRMSLNISPVVIRLLAAVAGGIATASEEDLKARREKKQLQQYPDLWSVKPFKETDFWFINSANQSERAEDAAVIERLFDDEPAVALLPQRATIKVDALTVRVEAGTDERTIPLIVFETELDGSARDWAGLLAADVEMRVQMAYFNERYGVWEPIIEPLPTSAFWSIAVQFKTNSIVDDDAAGEDSVLQPAKNELTVSAPHRLETTITRSCIEVLMRLKDAFEKASRLQELPTAIALPGTAPVVVINETGLNVEIMNSDSLTLLGRTQVNALTVEHGGFAELRPAVVDRDASLLRRQDSNEQWTVNMKFPTLGGGPREVNVSRAEQRSFELPQRWSVSGEQWRVIVRISAEYGRKIVVLRSLLQVINHLPVPVDVFTLVDTNLEKCGRVEGNGAQLSIGMPAVYSPDGEMYFQPSADTYDISAESLKWVSGKDNLVTTEFLRCGAFENRDKAFYLQARLELEQAYFENTRIKNLKSNCFTMHLHPSVTLHNMLPFPLEVHAPHSDAVRLNSGESKFLSTVCPGRSAITVNLLASKRWSCEFQVQDKPAELSVLTFKGHNLLNLGLHATSKYGQFDLSIYAPFWMVNKTGLSLVYKGIGYEDETAHNADESQPVLFSFRKEDFFDKKKMNLRVESSEWSPAVPLDTVGSAGRVSCKASDGNVFEVAMNVQLSESGLTKICTFTPFYIFCNRSVAPVEVAEVDATLPANWIRVDSSQCAGFWPRQKANRKLLTARYSGTSEQSQGFVFTETAESFARMANDYGGAYVSTTVSEGSVVVEVDDYADGKAPVLLINYSDKPISFQQKDIPASKFALRPNEHCLWTWNSLEVAQQLVWKMDGVEKEEVAQLHKDDMKLFHSKKDANYFWVAFLNGRQRSLLFTGDLAVATIAYQAYQLEPLDSKVVISLEGVGLSIVNNQIPAEIAYAAITSSGALWEQKRKRFKPMNAKESQSLEAAYQRYKAEKAAGRANAKHVVAVDKMHVDLETMRVVKPGERELRRTYQSGLWMLYQTSAHQTQVHVKLQHVQVDNQLPACVFPVVFAPVPLAKSVAADTAVKPLVELSLVMSISEVGGFKQFKYLKVLVQEMAVKIDQGFINAMIAMAANDENAVVYGTDLFEKDIAKTREDLSSLAELSAKTGQKHFFELLHFSPLMVHLSFSQGGSSGDANKKSVQIQSEFINLLLKSVGVTLTELQDVIFKLAYFERENVFLSESQVQAEATSHYASQAIKQIYVLVLGLDIIGNPFGLVRDLTSGVEDLFYEPFQGAIQGPEEFAEGLALGVRSLFGHAVGGAAGAVGRIAGTLGKGIAALTMDDEYQRKRQEALNRRPANVGEGLAQGGKGLVTGVYDGVTGVFTKPLEGAREGGVGGFAKGLGKGLVGVVARPATGVVDFASSGLSAVKQVADTTAETKRLRTARFIPADKIIRAYNKDDAEGNKLLADTEKGKFVTTDHYVAHVFVSKDCRYAFVTTDQRVMVVKRHDVFGSWEVDWQIPYVDMLQEPTLTDDGLRVELRERKKKFLGIIGSGSKGCVVKIADDETAKWISAKTVDAFKQATN